MCRAVFEIPTISITSDESQEENETSAASVLPATVASSLPVNRFVSSMLAAASSSSSSLGKGHADPNNVLCEICEEDQASEFCKDCAQAFCTTCKKPHLKARANVHHQFISLDEAMKPGARYGGFTSRTTQCEKHPLLLINSFCHTDQQAVCTECVVDMHMGHQVERLVNVVENQKAEISNLLNKVSPQLSVVVSLLTALSC